MSDCARARGDEGRRPQTHGRAFARGARTRNTLKCDPPRCSTPLMSTIARPRAPATSSTAVTIRLHPSSSCSSRDTITLSRFNILPPHTRLTSFAGRGFGGEVGDGGGWSRRA